MCRRKLFVVLSLASLPSCGVMSNLFSPFLENRTTAPESPFEDSGLTEYFRDKFFAPTNVEAQLRKYHDVNTSEDDRQRLRNELVTALAFLVDAEYEHYTDKLMTNKSGWSFITTVGQLGVDAAGAVTGHAATSKLMSAISAGLTGTGEAFDTVWFSERSIPVIVTQMNASRSVKREALLRQLSLSTKEFPLAQALSEAVDYYNSGTLVNALAELAEEASKAQRDARVEKRLRIDAALESAVKTRRPI